MKEINQKVIESSEKTFADMIAKNPLFFEGLKGEEMQVRIKKALKETQSFGNKDR